MPTVTLTTYRDALDHAYDYLGDDRSARAARSARQAVLGAYRRLGQETKWTLYYHRHRFSTNAPYSTGTVTFDFTGGTYERELTLASGTWPEWAAYGAVVLNNIAYEVAERKSSTVLTLTVASNPGADVAAGTTYSLVRDTYPLPVDFLACDRLLNLTNTVPVFYGHPRQWANRQVVYQSAGSPYLFSVTGEPNYQGVLALQLYPAPDQAYAFEYLYQRKPRPLTVDEYKVGTVSVSAGATAVTGSGTAWTSAHVGSVIRFGDTLNHPTGLTGTYPFQEERVVMEVTNTTALVVDAALVNTYSGNKYVLSDPVDVDEVMLNAFWRGIALELSKLRRIEGLGDVTALYQMDLRQAMAADSRHMGRRAAGDGLVWVAPPGPIGEDVE